MYACSYFINGKGQRNMSKGTWLISRRAGTLHRSIALHVGGEHQDVGKLSYWMLPYWTIRVLRPAPSLVLTMSVSCRYVCLTIPLMSVYLNVWPTSLTSIPRGFFSYTICFPSSLSSFHKWHQHPLNNSDQKRRRYIHVLSDPQTQLNSPEIPMSLTPKKRLGSDCSSAGSLFFFFSFWHHHRACGILVPQPGMEPMSPQ